METPGTSTVVTMVHQHGGLAEQESCIWARLLFPFNPPGTRMSLTVNYRLNFEKQIWIFVLNFNFKFLQFKYTFSMQIFTFSNTVWNDMIQIQTFSSIIHVSLLFQPTDGLMRRWILALIHILTCIERISFIHRETTLYSCVFSRFFLRFISVLQRMFILHWWC